MHGRCWPMLVRRTRFATSMITASAIVGVSVLLGGCANGTIANVSDVRVKVVKKTCSANNAETWTIKTKNTAGGMDWPMVVVTRTGGADDHVWFNGTLEHGKSFNQDFTVPANGSPVDVLVDRKDMYKSGEWWPTPYYAHTFGNTCAPAHPAPAPRSVPKPAAPSGTPAAKPNLVHTAGNGHITVTMAHFCGDVAWTIKITNNTGSARKVLAGRSFTKLDPISVAAHSSTTVQVKKSDLHNTSASAQEIGDPNFNMVLERSNC